MSPGGTSRPPRTAPGTGGGRAAAVRHRPHGPAWKVTPVRPRGEPWGAASPGSSGRHDHLQSPLPLTARALPGAARPGGEGDAISGSPPSACRTSLPRAEGTRGARYRRGPGTDHVCRKQRVHQTLEVTSAARLRPWQRCAEVPCRGGGRGRARPPGGCSRGRRRPTLLRSKRELQLPACLGGGAPHPRSPLAVATPPLAPFAEEQRGASGAGPLWGDAWLRGAGGLRQARAPLTAHARSAMRLRRAGGGGGGGARAGGGARGCCGDARDRAR